MDSDLTFAVSDVVIPVWIDSHHSVNDSRCDGRTGQWRVDLVCGVPAHSNH